MNMENLNKLINAYQKWEGSIYWNQLDCAAAMIQRINGAEHISAENIRPGVIRDFLDIAPDVAQTMFWWGASYPHKGSATNLINVISPEDRKNYIISALVRLGESDGEIWDLSPAA